MSDTSPILVRVEHRFRASAERVFDAWLDPAMIGRFMFGPALRDEEVLRIQVDAREGGAFSFLVRRGGQEIDHVGNYLEIDRPRRLVFTWGTADTLPETSRVTIDIVRVKSVAGDVETKLTLKHEIAPKWADFAERVQSGWTKMVTALGGIVDNGERRDEWACDVMIPEGSKTFAGWLSAAIPPVRQYSPRQNSTLAGVAQLPLRRGTRKPRERTQSLRSQPNRRAPRRAVAFGT